MGKRFMFFFEGGQKESLQRFVSNIISYYRHPSLALSLVLAHEQRTPLEWALEVPRPSNDTWRTHG